MGIRITSSSSRLRLVWIGLCRVPVVAMTVAVVACGGGYGGAGNSSALGASPGASRVSVGTITGFGSVHLNGLKFESTGAAINVDGKAATQNDLHVGDVIEVKGHHDSASNKDIADAIEFRGNIQGPVSAIDTIAQTLVVLGQTVVASSDTSFDDGISPASLAGTNIGDILEVSGLTAADGTVHATRIERQPAGAGLQVIGAAASTDSTARTLMIGSLLVDFSIASLVDFPSTGPKDGDLVEASGTTLGSGGALEATRLELRTGKELKADANDRSEVEGLITRFASTTDFDVAGRPVTTAANTTFEGGTASDLALNVRVEVEGSVDAAGAIAATKVRIGHPADTRVTGQVDSVDAIAGTAVVLGITIGVDAMTHFEDHGPRKSETFSLADVHGGDWLDIRGQQASAGGDSVAAMRVDRLQAQSAVQLSGAVASAAQPDFTILSAAVATTPVTQFDNGLNATMFFAAPVGKTVSARGSWNGTTLDAAEVQLGEDNQD